MINTILGISIIAALFVGLAFVCRYGMDGMTWAGIGIMFGISFAIVGIVCSATSLIMKSMK